MQYETRGTAGYVMTRPGESVQAWKRRCRIAQNVLKYGIRVHCLACGAKGRHFKEKDGPLGKRPCPKCSLQMLTRGLAEEVEQKAQASGKRMHPWED